MAEDMKRDERIKEAVRDAYGSIARDFVEESDNASCCSPRQAPSCCGTDQPTSCCGKSEGVGEPRRIGSSVYAGPEVADLPDSVTDISLGCGNPTAIAELQPGETVLDLGSGGGIDCFLAAKKVGPEGRVIGLDMTPDMIKLARRNAKKVGATNVDFRYGEMEDIPLPDESVDAVISNCVVNLSPDKDAVFGEVHRVLRPGGRISISDIVIYGQLPEPVRERLDMWASCLSGALDETEYLGKIRSAGFANVEIASRDYVRISEFADRKDVEALLGEASLAPGDLDRKVASIKVKARKAT